MKEVAVWTRHGEGVGRKGRDDGENGQSGEAAPVEETKCHTQVHSF